MLVFSGFVLAFERALLAQASAYGEAQQQEGEACGDHGEDVEKNGEGVDPFFEEIGREERQQGEAEEEGEVGVEDGLIGLIGAVNEVVVIYPVDPGEGEGEGVDGEGGKDGAEAGKSVLAGDFEIQDHDGDDDCDDSVGEGFEAGWGTDEIRHGRCPY